MSVYNNQQFDALQRAYQSMAGGVGCANCAPVSVPQVHVAPAPVQIMQPSSPPQYVHYTPMVWSPLPTAPNDAPSSNGDASKSDEPSQLEEKLTELVDLLAKKEPETETQPEEAKPDPVEDKLDTLIELLGPMADQQSGQGKFATDRRQDVQLDRIKDGSLRALGQAIREFDRELDQLEAWLDRDRRAF